MQRQGRNSYPRQVSPTRCTPHTEDDDWWNQKLPYEYSRSDRKAPPLPKEKCLGTGKGMVPDDRYVPYCVETEHADDDDTSASYPPEVDRVEETATAGRQSSNTNNMTEMIASIEIAPGEYRTVLGAAASWRSIEEDSFVVTTCWSCDTMVFNVPQAAYVLCPACRSVNPMEDPSEKEDVIGLGFTMSDLEGWHQK